MKKISIIVGALAVAASSPALANEGRVEARSGVYWSDGFSDATVGVAAGYDWSMGERGFVGAEVTGDKVLTNGAKVSFGVNARGGAKLANGAKLYVTGGWNSEPCDLCEGGASAGAGVEFPFGNAFYGKVEYRHFFVGNGFSDANVAVAGLGVRF